MDKENPAVRKYIAQRADLLGAIRLPNNTFKGNAGTEVVSDILILQKRDRLIDLEPEWVHLNTDENGVKMNAYFVDHPEMVLGEWKTVSGRFGEEDTVCLLYTSNSNFESYIQVVKVDAETGKTIPYAGAGFQIYDPSGNLITMEFTYPTPTTVDTFYTDANGSLVTPEKLPYGQGFSIVEVQSPYGYVLDSTPVYFDVTEENSSEESGVTVIKVEKTNMPQKGTISIEKTGEVFFGVSVSGGTDENGQELPVIYQPVYETQGLPDTVYEIRAAEDVVTPDGTLRYSKGELVDTVTTDETGFAKSKELYLGKYEVKEVKAGYGMVLSLSLIHI